ncbi:hypothetical protein P22_1675 [Propionispora sp. 2/2-37]|uniref:nucleotidyltransferase n=1 Tax=Propionispora sp. 2/2-37 TaxID=1677858 RepID=UPI0006BB543F|nr:nucleotidyltransferase [Propionispora sp. 2/2-37]CUH95601.1 hypothetical protein P22_1675 [Propionispora sp. 2/2-37]
MQAVGIIAEYNPFHSGHQWHIGKAKEISGCPFAIVVMSGNFVQRGEPAIFDKWLRAEMAVSSGADLVIELPVVFSLRSAQYFAAGGIRLLKSLGLVSHVSFGTETDDLPRLKHLAEIIDRPQTGHLLRKLLKNGTTYAAALSRALQLVQNGTPYELKSPNDILAVEYLRSLRHFAPDMIPCPVKRQYAQYHDTKIHSPFASATAVRLAILEQPQNPDANLKTVLPKSSQMLIHRAVTEGKGPVTLAGFDSILLAKLRLFSLTQLEELPDITEGLHNKIAECALHALSLDDLLHQLKSRRYPRSRLQRILMHALIGTNKQLLSDFDTTGPLYARILAFNHNGRQMLKSLSSCTAIPLVTKTTHFLNSKQRSRGPLSPLQNMLAIDTYASDIYPLAMPNRKWWFGGRDFCVSPVYLPD